MDARQHELGSAPGDRGREQEAMPEQAVDVDRLAVAADALNKSWKGKGRALALLKYYDITQPIVEPNTGKAFGEVRLYLRRDVITDAVITVRTIAVGDRRGGGDRSGHRPATTRR